MSQALPYSTPGSAFGGALPLHRRKFSYVGLYLGLIVFMLSGYALLGRGFAYLGHAPVFIGEVALMLGCFLYSITRGATQSVSLPQFPFLCLFMIWGACRTFPFIPVYGFDALRDGVIWAYMMYAVVIAGLLLVEPHWLPRIFWKYRTFAIGLLILMPSMLVGKALMKGMLPDVPGTSVCIFSPRRGNTMVHMATICAFVIAGFADRRTVLVAIVTVPFMLLSGDSNRAGILTFAVSVGMATVLSRINKHSVNLWGSMAAMILVGGVIGANITIPGQQTSPLDADKLYDKVLGIVGLSTTARNVNSADWRLNWWGKIMHYTVLDGPYFWQGKGFGINLADDDGFQVEKEDALRDPHSIHFDILARTGVPGAAMWIVIQASMGIPLFRRYLECRKLGDPRWSGVFLVLLTYWTAHMTNASFDVDLEGPPGGIWFWVFYGIAMATLAIHRRYPQVMYQDPDWDRHEGEQKQPPPKRSTYYKQLAAYNWQRGPMLPAVEVVAPRQQGVRV